MCASGGGWIRFSCTGSQNEKEREITERKTYLVHMFQKNTKNTHNMKSKLLAFKHIKSQKARRLFGLMARCFSLLLIPLFCLSLLRSALIISWLLPALSNHS